MTHPSHFQYHRALANKGNMKPKRVKHSLPRYVENVLGVMADGKPHTLKQLSDKIGLQETTIITYINVLRNVYGFEIIKSYTGKAGKKHIYAYKLIG